MHVHTAKEEVEIQKVKGVYDGEGNLNKKINVLKSFDTGVVVLKAKRSLCVEKFSDYPKLGHFTIRD